MEFLHEGSPQTVIDEARARQHVQAMLAQLRKRGPLARVLILPPDMTRLHSWAGFLTCELYEQLHPHADIAILPAVGTHLPMSSDELTHMFPGVPHSAFHAHDWRNGVLPLGEVPASLVHRLSEGKLDFSIKVELDRLLIKEKWDAIISVGQLVPHEVIGIANHAKNVFVGVGGSDLINKSHWLGAVYGIERIMGRADTPVRAVLDYASEHLAKHLSIVYLLTVRARGIEGNLVTRGLYAGDDRACFERGAALCRQVNLDLLPRAPKKVVLAGQQGDLPHAPGDCRRRRVDRAGPWRALLRRGYDDRSAHPPVRLSRHAEHAGQGPQRAGVGCQSLSVGALDPRIVGRTIHDHLLSRSIEPGGHRRRRISIWRFASDEEPI